MTKRTIFISYSHDSPKHSERVLNLAWALRSNGIDVEIDQFHNEEIIDWPRWCNEQTGAEHSEFVVCICTTEYRRRIEGDVPPEKGKGVHWEGGLLDDDLYDAKGNSRLIPVLLDREPESSIPRFLRGWTHCRMRQFVLDDPGYEHLLRILTARAKVEKNALGSVPVLSTKRAPTGSQSAARADFHADISRIVKYAPTELIGREEELKLLNGTWTKVKRGTKKRRHILTFVALGGEGKTSLVAKWAAELAHRDWPGCEAVFAWSFYSQGTREQVAASSDLFLKEALTFFGDPVLAGSAAGAFDKGRRLAQLVGERRALLILDGLEPLQYAPASPTPGELKDQGIAALLKGLATTSRGLCIVTSRYSLPDLRAFWQTAASEKELKRLSRDAGVHLLKAHGVTGSDRRNIPLGDHTEMVSEFEKLVEDVDGHALTLHIMGSFLKKAFHGDIRCRDRVTFEKASQKTDDNRAFRAMAAYEKWMEDGSDEAKRELAILRAVGFFDRPATADCLQALLKDPAIPGLTEPLVGLQEDDWNCSLDSLETARLVTVNREASAIPHSALRIPHSLDAHPLLREYFAGRLRQQHPDAYRAAHRRLYEHLCATTPNKAQPTLEDLQPLYQAVAHGCQAGSHQEVWEKVYYKQISRGLEFYSTDKLGVFGSDLGAVACFFDTPWGRVSAELSADAQAWLLNEAAFSLRALGRLTEAIEPMRAGLEMGVQQENWAESARRAVNLCELELTLGEVARAVNHAEQSMKYAARSDDDFWPVQSCVRFADALHQAGRREDSQARIRQAEAMWASRHSAHPLVFSKTDLMTNFLYCDHHLAAPEHAAWRLTLDSSLPDPNFSLREACKRVTQRSEQTLQCAESQVLAAPLQVAVDQLSLGRAALYDAILSKSQIESSRSKIDLAVSSLRRAGDITRLPLGLLTRAWLRFVAGQRTGAESAQSDLDEAWEIAERGSMKLFLADIRLYRARLFGRQEEETENSYPWQSPAADLAAAETLIKACGYHRRDEELADAKAALLVSLAVNQV